jgi:NADH dehydrogenase FAD-containing subunit
LKSWYPELAGKIRITLVEALPSVLPMFSKQLIDYTESTFKESKIEILTKTMVKEVSFLSKYAYFCETKIPPIGQGQKRRATDAG